MFRLYEKFAVNSPVVVLIVIPCLIVLFGASMGYTIIDWKLEFGECEILKMNFIFTNVSIFVFIALAFTVLTSYMQFCYLKNASATDKISVYRNWRKTAIIGFLFLILTILGDYCKFKINYLNFNYLQLGLLSIVYSIMIYLPYVYKKELEKEKIQ